MGFFNQLKEQAFEKAKEEMMQNLGVPPEIIESLTGAVGGGGGGANKKSGRMSQEEYEATKPAEMRKDIRMISGCEDSQTSADVSNVASFQLPDPAGTLDSSCALDCIICSYFSLISNESLTYMNMNTPACTLCPGESHRSSWWSLYFHPP